MRRGARQSQIINNWFSLATIILVTIVLTLYVKYIVKEKPRLNSSLACQLLNNSSDKIINQKLLNMQNALILKGRYILDGGILEALDTTSFIKSKIKVSKSNQYFMQELNVLSTNTHKQYVKIKYEFIENEEKNTKTLARLLSSFRINGKESFIISIDLLSYTNETIQEAISCTIKAFKYNVTKTLP